MINIKDAFYIDIASDNKETLKDASLNLTISHRMAIYNEQKTQSPWVNNQGNTLPTHRYYLDSQASLITAYNKVNNDGFPGLAISHPEHPYKAKTFGHIAHLGVEIYRWVEFEETFNPAFTYTQDMLNFDCEQPPFIPGTNMYYDIEVTMDILGNTELDVTNEENKVCSVCILFVGQNCRPVGVKLSLTFLEAGNWETKMLKDDDFDDEILTFTGTFRTERDLIVAWAEVLRVFNPVNMIDYNGSHFDMEWLLHRFEKYGIQECISHLGARNKTMKGGTLLTMFEQFGGSKRDKRYTVHGPTFAHLDLMLYIVNNGLFDKRSGRGLNAVCTKYGLKGKIGIKHWLMSLVFQTYWARNDKDILDKIEELLNDKVISMTTEVDNIINFIQRRDEKAFQTYAEAMMKDYTYYCFNDTYITWKLAEKLVLIDSLYILGSVTKTYVGGCLYNGVSMRLKGLLTKYAEDGGLRYGYQHDNKFNEGVYILGGITLPPLDLDPINQDILVTLDMSSFYPTIMAELNIGPDTISTKYVPGALDFSVYFAETLTEITEETPTQTLYIRQDRPSIYSKIVVDLLTARKAAKAAMKKETDPSKKKALDARQLALKLTSNALYGFLASAADKNYPFVNHCCGTAITQYAGSVLCLIALYMYDKYNMIPVMAVTDSLAFLIDPKWCDLLNIPEKERNQWRFEMGLYLCQKLEKDINEFLKILFKDIDCYLSIACENLHWGLNIHVMKRYVYRALDKSKTSFEDAHAAGSNKVVGYTQIRVDSAPIINIISDMIDKYLVGIAPRNYMAIGHEIIAIRDRCMEDPTQVSKLKDLMSANADSKGIRYHMIVLNKLGIIRDLPPLFERQYVMQVDYGCEYYDPATQTKREWQKMHLGYITDIAKEKGLKPYKKYVDDLILNLIKEKIHKDYQGEVIHHAKLKQTKERSSITMLERQAATGKVCEILNLGRTYKSTRPGVYPILTLETLEQPRIILKNFEEYAHLFKQYTNGDNALPTTILGLNKGSFDELFGYIKGMGIYVSIEYNKALVTMKETKEFPKENRERLEMLRPMLAEVHARLKELIKKIIRTAIQN